MVGWIISGLFVLLVAVLVIRALLFQPKPELPFDREEVEFDRQAAEKTLQALIRCKTVSYNDPAMEDEAEFQKLLSILPQLFPRVFEICSYLELPDRAVLMRWPGKSGKAPTVLMAHYDVVPVNEDSWEKPPFDGVLEDGVLWGRGTLDTKVTLNGILSAANHLIGTGFVPENDIYFAFSGCEEINGLGARHIVNYFREHGVQPALVLDEGGAVVENVFPGVNKPCAMVGIAEKGLINARFSVDFIGGHASAPTPVTPLYRLSKTLLHIIHHPYKMHLTEPAAALFDTLGRHSTFLVKLLFANLWLFRPVLDLFTRKTGGEINALLRTTTAFTQAHGSKARNSLPTHANLICNMRLCPADTVESAAAQLRKLVKDPAVKLEILESHNPSPVSDPNSEAFRKISASISETWTGCIVSPYLMVQCSDSRHYSDFSDKVFRFSAMALTKQERSTIHGNNERIRQVNIHDSAEFFLRLMKKC